MADKRIEIAPNIFMTMDLRNVWVEQDTQYFDEKKGEERIKTTQLTGFCGSFAHALASLAKKNVMSADVKTAHELLEKCAEWELKIEKMAEQLTANLPTIKELSL